VCALDDLVASLHAPHYHPEVARRLVQVAMEGAAVDADTPALRETASTLLAQLTALGRLK
jgi:hypothetical protein